MLVFWNHFKSKRVKSNTVSSAQQTVVVILLANSRQQAGCAVNKSCHCTDCEQRKQLFKHILCSDLSRFHIFDSSVLSLGSWRKCDISNITHFTTKLDCHYIASWEQILPILQCWLVVNGSHKNFYKVLFRITTKTSSLYASSLHTASKGQEWDACTYVKAFGFSP